MTLERIFYTYMAAAGAAAGAILVAAPQAQDYAVRPYFWVLMAVLAFDVGVFLRWRNAPGTMLPMTARVIGFFIGIALMVAIPVIARAPGRLF